jgi:DNA packaging protein, QLRG family
MLDKVKLFLRIEKDYTEEDDLLNQFIMEAREYCGNAIGYIPGNNNLIFERFVLMYVANAYDNRELTGNSYAKTNYNYMPLLAQLRYCREE